MKEKNDKEQGNKETETTEAIVFIKKNDRINKTWECYTLNKNALWGYMVENIWRKTKN